MIWIQKCAHKWIQITINRAVACALAERTEPALMLQSQAICQNISP